MAEWRVGQGEERAASFGTAAGRHVRAAAGFIRRALARGLRATFAAIWKTIRAFFLWLVVKSPLAEPRRSAHRPLLQLIPWLIVAVGWGAITLLAVVTYYATVLPDPRQAMVLRLPPNLTILARGGEFIAERGMRRNYVPYAEIPPNIVKAVLATEDRRFFYHFGLDPIGLARAASRNWNSGEVVQGGSTITQQLVKNLFLQPKRTWTRKAEEFILAIWLESRFSKQQILEFYLNRVYFGGGNFGIGAAAHSYFGKEPKDVTLAEAALLAGLIKAPSYYSPTSNMDRARDRSKEILRILAETDQIDINQYAEALAHPAELKVPPSKPGFGFVADWVAEVAPMLTGETDRNLVVETTIDAGLQLAARTAVEDIIRNKGRTARATEAAVLLMTPDGAIRAMIGGRNHAESQFNRAVRAMRQPGSAFKPFIYLAAVESGWMPDMKIEDRPIEVDGWKPSNFGDIYRGEITLRQALTHSSNMAAVRLAKAVGTDRVVEVANRLGVMSAKNVGLTMALGTSETTLLEMTSGFAVFANGGFSVVPEIVERIRDDQGRVLFERSKAPPPRIVSPRAISAMNDMMNSVVAGGTAMAASLDFYPAAGKTGTSQKYKDAWFIGYTAQWVGGVWMGNDNASPMRGVTGGSLPAEIWKQIMLKAHEGLMAKALPGTALPPEFIQHTADAIGLSNVPARNPFRRREVSDAEAVPAAPSALAPGRPRRAPL
ncbi:transglycosylase domain-containing protein [Rhodomicrobium lacus]|uniref:transglycosylase domain-containing protein n=1 Tax=Rhodomicrobium lacus TaxID=2498452 RepID=UPI000F8EEF2A|nr:PBP1A family penicillin-binding protein [Rhodomicrobium lacus]